MKSSYHINDYQERLRIASHHNERLQTVKQSKAGKKRILSTNSKMPHPRFRTNWEENSYWRHHDNYMEEKQAMEEEQAREEAEQNKPKPNRQGFVAAGDGWFTVTNTNTNTKRNRNKH